VIEGDLEWEVERIVKSEIISNRRKVRGMNKPMQELRCFVKWKGCAADENTWEPPEGMENAQDGWKGSIEGTWRCRAPKRSSSLIKVFHRWTTKRRWFIPLLCGA